MGQSIKLSPANSFKSNYLFRISYCHMLSDVVKNKINLPQWRTRLNFQACLQHKYQVHYARLYIVTYGPKQNE